MYDTYMDMFFSRESEKSDIVKEHRDLLVDIHRYLAWKLQTDAEGGASGSIEYEELRRTLLEYLQSQGENTSIVQDLFNGVIERVGALVSRVQETYEFEVQPLREYFAARYLYETAPYSPAGSEKSGTKLERFDALARNPYWLNVARFYAGCFSKGEISALVDALFEVASSDPYEHTSHPRTLALMLLGDWVFTQYQPAVRRVVQLIGQRPQMRQLLANAERDGVGVWTALPERCGKGDFVDILFTRLLDTQSSDERGAVGQALKQNLDVLERLERWGAVRDPIDSQSSLSMGQALGVLATAPSDRLLTILGDRTADAIDWLVRSNRFEVLASDTKLHDAAERCLLHGQPRSFYRLDQTTGELPDLAVLAEILGPFQYQQIFGEESSTSLRGLLQSRHGVRSALHRAGKGENKPPKLSAAYAPVVAAYEEFLDLSPAALATSLGPWSALVETLRSSWGEVPAVYRIAAFASGVRSKDDVGAAPNGMFDTQTKLVDRFRYARLKSGAPAWWIRQLDEASDNNRVPLLLLLWSWATPRTIFRLVERLTTLLDGLPDSDWKSLAADASVVSVAFRRRDELPALSGPDLETIKTLSPRMLVFVGRRVAWETRHAIVKESLLTYGENDPVVLQFASETMATSIRRTADWRTALPLIRETYRRGTFFYAPSQREQTLGVKEATLVSRDPDCYPLSIVAEADAVLKGKAGAKARSLLQIATSDRWFDASEVQTG